MSLDSRLIRGFILILTLASQGCGLDTSFNIEFRVRLGVSPDHAASGAMLTFTLSNDGDGVVSAEGDRFVLVVGDASGTAVRHIEFTSGESTLRPGDSLSEIWDQTDGAGSLVAPGDYTVTVRYRAGEDTRRKTESFTIG